MHILIVDGHPDRSEQRFCHALAAAYAEGARQSGHEVRVITIANIDIPFLRQRGAYLVELLETAKQIFVALQNPPE